MEVNWEVNGEIKWTDARGPLLHSLVTEHRHRPLVELKFQQGLRSDVSAGWGAGERADTEPGMCYVSLIFEGAPILHSEAHGTLDHICIIYV